MDKVKNIALWTGILVYLVFALSFTGEKRRNIICSKMEVRILDSLQETFVTKKGIQHYIFDMDLKVLGEPVNSINTRRLENELNKRKHIKKAEAFFTADGRLHLEIDQRNPIVRVINKKGQNYYIDEEGAIIPLSVNHASHVLVASGEIREFFEVARTDWLRCPNDLGGNVNYSICEIYNLARYIHQNPFWNAQIEQIYRNEKGEYELIPRVGAHLIILGEFDQYREKLRNLRVFYKKGLNNVGWNQYLKISLKYDNQIICTKR